MINIGNISITKLFLGSTQVSKAYRGDIQIWPIENNYVTFTAQQANSTIGLALLSTNQTLEYSTDEVNWSTFDTSVTITLANVGDEVYIRGVLSGNNTSSNYTQFTMTGLIAATGNCNTLWNYNQGDSLKTHCGYSMFAGCSSLTTAPELPATVLENMCYASMFRGCSSLTAAPELPATTLADWCYLSMFEGCSSLITAPVLPATTLANHCYHSMFYDCTNLTTAPELPATALAEGCYQIMFAECSSLNYIKCLAVNGINTNDSTTDWVSGVSANGTFVKDASASWPSGDNGIPSGWTIENA